MKRAIKTAARLAAVAGTAVGAEAAVNRFLMGQGGVTESALPGKHQRYRWRLGQLYYAVAGEGPPVLLVHGVGAGCSSFEWRAVFSALAAQFQVYAVDLLGFGLSDRPIMDHSGRFYVQLIDDFIRHVIGRQATVIASSTSAAYAVRLAFTRPERIRALGIICPQGVQPYDTGAARERAGRLLKAPLLGDSTYLALSSRANIARTLREDLYYDAGKVTEPLIDQYYKSSHQPNAKYAVASFISGQLDLDVKEEFGAIKQPTLMVWGADSVFTPVTAARVYQETNPRAILEIFQETRQLPHDEKPDDFNRLLLSWLPEHTKDQVLRIL